MRDKTRPSKSREPGFVGNSDDWFDEARYQKPKGQANFDEAN